MKCWVERSYLLTLVALQPADSLTALQPKITRFVCKARDFSCVSVQNKLRSLMWILKGQCTDLKTTRTRVANRSLRTAGSLKKVKERNTSSEEKVPTCNTQRKINLLHKHKPDSVLLIWKGFCYDGVIVFRLRPTWFPLVPEGPSFPGWPWGGR